MKIPELRATLLERFGKDYLSELKKQVRPKKPKPKKKGY